MIIDIPIATTPAALVTVLAAISTPSSGLVASMEDIPLSKSIQDLVGGKSTLQDGVSAIFNCSPWLLKKLLPFEGLSRAISARAGV